MSKDGRKSTFRFPFDINPMVFIGLALVFFVLSIRQVGEYILPKVSVKDLSRRIEKVIQNDIQQFQESFADTALFNHAIADSLTPEQHNKLTQLPFVYQLYKGRQLMFWNATLLDLLSDTLPEQKPVVHKAANGTYVLYTVRWGMLRQNRAVLIIPIKRQNNFESEYMRNYFYADRQQNDFGIFINPEAVHKSEPVKWKGETLFYLYSRSTQRPTGDNYLHLLYYALTFIFFGISIHTYLKVTVKKRTPIKVFAWLLLTAIGIRALTYLTGFPNDFSGYAIFSSSYFRIDAVNRSVGDVFINVCLCFWILLFYAVNVQGKVRAIKGRIENYVFGTVKLIICVLLHLYFINLVYSLILDSTINFDITLISRFNLISFFGLISFLVIFANLFLISFITNHYANTSFPNRYIKYILLLVITVGVKFILHTSHQVAFLNYIVWAASVFLILDYTSSKIRFDFNSFYLIVWIVMVSFFGGYMLTRLNIDKEMKLRKQFADYVLRGKDLPLEQRLVKFRQAVSNDPTIKVLLTKDSLQNYQEIVNYTYLQYFDEWMSRYRYTVHMFDKQGRSATPHDTLSLTQYLSAFQGHAQPLSDSLVYYLHDHEDHRYYVVCPVSDQNKQVSTIIYQFYETLSVFDESNTDFILHGGIKSEFKENKYSFAIYEKDRLVARKGNYAFVSVIHAADLFAKDNLVYVKRSGYSKMWYYLPASRKAIVVVKKSNEFIMLTTLFAYSFFIYFSTISLYILGNIIARSNLNTKRFFNLLSLNLRLKIQLSILFVVFTSFMVIGYLTTRYLSERIREKSRAEISNYATQIQTELGGMINNGPGAAAMLSAGKLSAAHINHISDLSRRFNVTVSLFRVDNATLIYSSQLDLFQSGAFSRRVPHTILYQLRYGNRESVIGSDAIGDFDYISSYCFIRDSVGRPLAILQLPYIFSNFEINAETNSVIVTIVNIYIFVFLISSLLALFISNSVSRPFKFIVRQFTKINLSKTNEPLKWNSSDEIGMLVKEYNRMLRKLENSTVLLAKNERELAWREMAKQVAHEIKNPLTPMKLSLQMLERAIKNNRPNVEEMTTRVTKTMIEQIDNLTLIATNFSNFAKLPEVKKEVIVLNEILHSVTGMYTDSTGFEYLFLIPDYPIHIYADRGQLIRVFTNIIQNAIQSIPSQNKGHISLMVSKIKDNFVRISISDNGEGISREKGKKLFQPYFTTKTSGTGLGLAMCKDIVEQFDGKIDFESMINEGTTFHIDLPVVDLDEHESTALDS